MKTLKQAAVFGGVMGVYAIASVYVVISFLPAGLGILIPIGGLATAVAFLWPTWFDRGVAGGAGRRLLRRLGLLASAVPMGAVASFLVVAAFPGFIEWGDNVHRQHLVRQGIDAAEVEARVAQHHQRPVHFLMDGAMATAMPGLIAVLVTTGAGAILLRKRPTRP